MPKISVIVPVYKAENYIHSCVDSILGQSFSDMEVFLVDDGSPDGCGAVCDEYAQKDSRVYVIHQANQGQAAARNRAIEKARGEWLCFVDSDDLIHPQMIQRLYDSAVENSAGVSMCPMVEAPELPVDFYREPSGAYTVSEINEENLVQMFDRDAYPAWVACAKLIRREHVMKHLFCEGRVFEDNEAVCHWICAGKTLVQLADPMYFYRTNPVSTTKSQFSVRKLDYLWALEQLIRFYSGMGYMGMKERFAHLYACELANCWEGASYVLKDPSLARQIEKRGKMFAREEKLSFCREDRERMLEAMHPKLMPFYWCYCSAVSVLREDGIAGLLKKIRKNRRENQ